MSTAPPPPESRSGGAAIIKDGLELCSDNSLRDQSQAPRHPRFSVLTGEYLRALRSTRFIDLGSLIGAGVTWQAITNAVPAHSRINVATINTFAFDDDGGSAFIRSSRPHSSSGFAPEADIRAGNHAGRDARLSEHADVEPLASCRLRR